MMDAMNRLLPHPLQQKQAYLISLRLLPMLSELEPIFTAGGAKRILWKRGDFMSEPKELLEYLVSQGKVEIESVKGSPSGYPSPQYRLLSEKGKQLKWEGLMPKSAIARELGFSRRYITKAVGEMLEKGLVSQVGERYECIQDLPKKRLKKVVKIDDKALLLKVALENCGRIPESWAPAEVIWEHDGKVKKFMATHRVENGQVVKA